jgi:hypothetical protein
MSLPKFLQSYLPSFDISKMDLRNPEDKWEIIESILNTGDMEMVKWLFKTYRVREIKQVVEDPRRGIWFRDSLDLWLKIFNIKLPKIVYDVAIFSLEPRHKLIMRYFNYMKRKGKVPKRTLKMWAEIDKVEKLMKKKMKKKLKK